jgi:haloalkane dehalogenase
LDEHRGQAKSSPQPAEDLSELWSARRKTELVLRLLRGGSCPQERSMNVTDTSWVDRDEYPFPSRYLALEMGRMHYIDEGEGEPVVMVHGTPDWSFVWRHLIRRLSAHWRCVAMDHVGFGLSDKPPGWSYRPEDHARNVKALIEKLDLGEMTLVVHDFGVPIGLAYALERPENVKRLVLFNGWLWPLESDRAIKRVMRVMTSPLGWFLYTRMNFSAKVIMKRAMGDKSKLTPSIHRQYLAPFPTRRQRQGPWGMAKGVLGSSVWYEALWQQRHRIASKPALVLWGMRDPAFRPHQLARWQSFLPHAEIVTFPEAGHFVQEEESTEVCRRVEVFLKNGYEIVVA